MSADLRAAVQRFVRAAKALEAIRQCEDTWGDDVRCELVEGHELLAGTPHRARLDDVAIEW